MDHRIRGIARIRRGGAIMELALILPIMFMLGFGVVDYGDYFYLRNTFQGAAAAGVRAAVPAAATNSNVTTVITSMLTAAGLSSSQYTVTLSPSDVSTASPGAAITVTITANWSAVGTKMLGTAFGGISGSKVISASAVMLRETGSTGGGSSSSSSSGSGSGSGYGSGSGFTWPF